VTGSGVSPAGADAESHALGLMAGWPLCGARSGFEEFDHAIGCRVRSMESTEDGLPRTSAWPARGS